MMSAGRRRSGGGGRDYGEDYGRDRHSIAFQKDKGAFLILLTQVICTG